ncbi:DUF2007 domain-containing protein [Winogradskyella sp. DF17]|jgi:predicted RNA-binding Zn-ribbon protein involved in translation (DUF1610 family)|uniref:DUF2007 domain-containing protein n=1 Tax=Winogradskyella pelagia TaxID=2819984 RepID=A0ABS3T5H5_9FLAO|nr:DUF2007 domain-containing protein [Winogradskyella sp. DF17]MBO3118008.1 DUF2007 domain-containing protein [Winogradskyella sp. DF17]
MSKTFTTIARYQYSSEAQIIKGRLEAEGIEVFLSDNITIDTDPLVSNAIGGVKLKVLSVDVIKAKHILSTIQSFSVDDNGERIQCPKCNNEHINIYSSIKDLKSLLSFILGFVSGTLPFSTRHHYKCDNCSFEFPIK